MMIIVTQGVLFLVRFFVCPAKLRKFPTVWTYHFFAYSKCQDKKSETIEMDILDYQIQPCHL